MYFRHFVCFSVILVLKLVVGQVAVVAPVGQCPGGPSLPIECDPKRPWPQCPPQSYCYATNSVDIGPYFCCPVWSTYGSQWRPTGPLQPIQAPVVEVAAPAVVTPVAAAAPVKARKQARPVVDPKIASAIGGWIQRQQ